MVPTPFPSAWWVIPGRLLVGPDPGHPDPRTTQSRLHRLLEAGVRVVLCLREDQERDARGQPFAPYEPTLRDLAADRDVRVSVVRFPLPARGAPPARAMAGLLEFIDALLEHGLPLYVHGDESQGRPATVVGCWLVRHHKSPDEALRHMARLRSGESRLRGCPVPAQPARLELLRSWPQGRGEGADAPAEARPVSPDQPVGTPRALAFMRAHHMAPAARGEAEELAFQLGEQRTSDTGEARTIIGYAFDPRGVAKYIVEIPYGLLAAKTARNANRQYSPPMGRKREVLDSLVSKRQADAE
ncbi:MAG: fused DSP-PTPase phosphatase/NAD kinase-like protein [Candidatus Brocadiia bacterium]